MAGHSHWARIKRAKAVTDARRGKAWSKLSRGIIVAARMGGGDPDANLALRYAIDAARAENMPKDTIERAIKKGTGGLEGVTYEELLYEGYGPGGAAVMCTVVTDNRTRTAGEIRNIFDNNGATLAATNSVARLFTKRGVFSVAAKDAGEERLTDIAIEAGADDVQPDGDAFELTCEPAAFEGLKQALAAAGITPLSAEVAMIASANVTLSGEKADQMVALIEALEDHDDVQKVYTNFELSEAEMQRMSR
jgi:YebC/PmpR family DNA-binding regulatory protein